MKTVARALGIRLLEKSDSDFLGLALSVSYPTVYFKAFFVEPSLLVGDMMVTRETQHEEHLL